MLTHDMHILHVTMAPSKTGGAWGTKFGSTALADVDGMVESEVPGGIRLHHIVTMVADMQRRQEGVPFAPKCDTVLAALDNPEKVLNKLAAKVSR